MADPKHGIVDLPAATQRDRYPIRMALLDLSAAWEAWFTPTE